MSPFSDLAFSAIEGYRASEMPGKEEGMGSGVGGLGSAKTGRRKSIFLTFSLKNTRERLEQIF